MKKTILYIERKKNEFVSLEKVFRQIAASLSEKFDTRFQQVPYGLKPIDTIRNLLFFRKGRADLYHITGHIHYIALLFKPSNTVLSIMDLRFLSANGPLRRFIIKKLYLDLPVRRLKYLTAISEQTKKEIVENTGCEPSKIRVLDLPLLDHLSVTVAKEFNESNPTLLQVGTMPNKNIVMLARALSGIECNLRIIGRLSRKQRDCLRENRVVFENAFDLSDEAMTREYENADILTFCSTYEGFGLPVIEGQAAGKPVVTSNISPLIETAGNAACLVDPRDADSIRQGILRIIHDTNYRQHLIEGGMKNVERFRPNIVAAQYENLYSEILGCSSKTHK